MAAALDAASAAKFLSLTDEDFEKAVACCELPAPSRVGGAPRWSRIRLEAWFGDDGSKPVPGHDPIAAA